MRFLAVSSTDATQKCKTKRVKTYARFEKCLVEFSLYALRCLRSRAHRLNMNPQFYVGLCIFALSLYVTHYMQKSWSNTCRIRWIWHVVILYLILLVGVARWYIRRSLNYMYNIRCLNFCNKYYTGTKGSRAYRKVGAFVSETASKLENLESNQQN